MCVCIPISLFVYFPLYTDWSCNCVQFSLPQIVCSLGGSSKIGSHDYFLLIVAMVLLLWRQIVLLWHQVTMVASEQHLYQTIVLPRKFATGSIHDYLFCYCPLVVILFVVLKIKGGGLQGHKQVILIVKVNSVAWNEVLICQWPIYYICVLWMKKRVCGLIMMVHGQLQSLTFLTILVLHELSWSNQNYCERFMMVHDRL